jgi:spore maturation protein CgeB
VKRSLRIAFFGSSLVSEFWNSSAVYFRGIIRALAERGHRITFYEPQAPAGESHRDIPNPEWAEVITYRAESSWAATQAAEQARGFDLVIKISGIGVNDAVLESAVVELKSPRTLVAFWDVDAASTLERMARSVSDPFLRLIPRYDVILTHGGGDALMGGYEALGAKICVSLASAFDPERHHPVEPDPRFAADLGFVGDCLPDRADRLETFFIRSANLLREKTFVLGGSHWWDWPLPANINYLGQIAPEDLNAFNCSPTAILSVMRESSLRYGFSPPTRLFEAAAAGACIITDLWPGLEHFLTPGVEVLVARDAVEVARHLQTLDQNRRRAVGAAARRRMLASHSYAHRAAEFEGLIEDRMDRAHEPAKAVFA